MMETQGALMSPPEARGSVVNGKDRQMLKEIYWKAIERRDPAFDGVFVTGVWSTGIYCRPTCPARRPNLNRVTFFQSPKEAEAAGYRACLRCHPADGAREDGPGAIVLAACRYIEDCGEDIPSLTALGKRVGMSPAHLQRVFKKALGVTPRQYADAHRLDRLKKSLQEGQAIAPALYDAGYGSSSRLYENAPRQLGMTPAAYQRGGEGEHVRFAVVRSALGPVLVAGTTRGLCRVGLGRTAAQLETVLRQEFPNARVERDEKGLHSWVQSLVNYLDGRLPLPQLPIDIRATAFQRRVWEELRRIPLGSTRSYAEVARRIGRPKAQRAVARACATNPLALVIPCHRVIRTDGGLGGYGGGGVKNKEKLLIMEKRLA